MPTLRPPTTRQEVFTIVDGDDGKELIVHDTRIIDRLERFASFESFYTVPPRIKVDQVLSFSGKIKASLRSPPLYPNEQVFIDPSYTTDRGLLKLVQILEAESQGSNDMMLRMAKKGVIAFKYLPNLFVVDSYAFVYVNGSPLAFLIEESQIVQGAFYTAFEVTGKYILCDGKNFKYTSETWTIMSFEDLVPIDSLTVQPLDESSALFETLELRGRKFEKFSLGYTYLEYSGNMLQMGWAPILFKANGRVMVDTINFAQLNPNYSMGASRMDTNRSHMDKSKLTSVPHHHYIICSPSVYGFSFSVKKWGQLFVDNLTPIVYNDHAFERLVLDPERKRLIMNLVTNENGKGMRNLDLIAHKGNGVIFLLHGSPGVGKTLTAESIAEYIHRPLYSVSAGELGTDVASLEKRLGEILEVTALWQAVVLIDEADIFLEARTDQDIQRNALVGIFLRLLEYHQGILFLTTNRVQTFDGAFKSRITLSLKYKELDSDARAKIWATVLDRAEGEDNWDLNLRELSEARLNGREIKNVVRLSKAMGENPDSPITMENIRKVLGMMSEFDKDIDSEKAVRRVGRTSSLHRYGFEKA
ncbi:UNVERIFIED_CONTAM: hypothetical protein HDU68_011678 [Siphonaria sp. JEL0065]|nr:hypothetical protein HDU68_011678 [Siphonaria sp. JEL0065]